MVGEERELRPLNLAVMAPADCEVVAIVQLRLRDGKTEAALNIVPGSSIPSGVPTALRWLADMVEIRQLDEVPGD